MKQQTTILAGALAALLLGGHAFAAELRIGTAAEPSSLDPHYHNLTPNNTVRRHIFESLVDQDAKQRLIPALAESWRAVDDKTWEFKLRKGVKFHDGSEFTAQDFVYTLCRIPNVANSPSSFTLYTKGVDAVETPDPYTIIVKTAAPYPLLPVEMTTFGIISAKAAGGEKVTFDKAGCKADSWPATQAFNDGTLTIGTGPFKLAEYRKGERIVLDRNPDYWGTKPEWDKVTFRPITSDGPRMAALLAGDVDLVDEPPLQDLERLRKDPKVSVVETLSNRVVYLALDQAEPTPTIKGTDGKNPLRDIRVREALSLAIDREAIVKRIMNNTAEPAAQLLAPGLFGTNPDLKVKSDQKKAKELLTAAGYPNGFELTIGTPNDRYINDEKIAQAVAQMYSRIGIKTQVDAATVNVFFSRRNKGEFSVYLAGWSAATGEASSPLKSLVATRIKEKGFGPTNYTSYSNPKLDELLTKALATVDDAAREKLLAETMKVAMEDYAVLPLHYEVTSWAMRKGLSYEPRADQYTLAASIRSAK
ncbi:ABC transporter substrate-binding protein [Microvirga subterranea]|uniref:Peptide/nickel transport system substrate-binding protein n=1 Tax=Microvirga subterranea TaxID=186651 RepID=A0A370HEA7_9HYPH|nr:ABC transporter substrate-binding protein [Microvirga subterranea]RDI54891.1 peptide/nickel transport system substrate-binding protein [Microvirga subterranea]